MPDHKIQSGWWGQFSVREGQTIQWQIGPLKLAVQRLQREWQIAYESQNNAAEETSAAEETGILSQDLDAPDIEALNYAHIERHPFDQTGETLRLTPTLADRPVVTRPEAPFYVAAGAETAMFVSSPLWLRLAVGHPPQPLQEIAIQRPSDTWFGPSTMEGELCYASRTSGRLNLGNIPWQADRAVTQVIIRNQVSNALLVERLSLPVPYLSLFESLDGMLWTQNVVLVRSREMGMAAIDIDSGPPEQAGQAKLVSEPRQYPDKSMVIRAFGALFK
ncbi:MAG: hypothetical protein JXM69_11015 [Anaerolineae bacterium]|nr:hypothetical protein [Anaerolineae bacterium]